MAVAQTALPLRLGRDESGRTDVLCSFACMIQPCITLACLQGVIVSLFSVTNCLGRMSTAFLPERLANGMVIPRTHFLVLGCAATAATSFLDAISTLDMMPYTSLATGAKQLRAA